jgi:predicted GNAT family acetyltransferase
VKSTNGLSPTSALNFQFWIVDGAPVAMVGTVRGTRHDPAIAGVYTPPPLRARRYAATWLRGGGVTAAVVEGVLAGCR